MKEVELNQNKLTRKSLEACIHCGLCLPACPTYLATGRETESPRGRIYLVDQLVSGKLPLTQRMADHLESCLGCLGCQTACPSGVNYEEILSGVRPDLAKRRPPLERFVSRFVFNQILTRYDLLKILAFFIGLIQRLFGRSFLTRVTDSLAPNTLLSPAGQILIKLSQWEKFSPEVRPHIPLPTMLTPKTQTEYGVHTLLFSGCVMDVFYNHVNHSAMRTLLKQGHSVAVPNQTCCGALAYHQGEEEIAKDLARKNIEKIGFGQDPIIVTAAGCGAMLKHYKHLFKDDNEMRHQAEEFSNRVYDLSEHLSRYSFVNHAKELEETTTYHAACHLSHAQNIHQEPLSLLANLENTQSPQLVNLPEQEHCCGSAGIYNLFNTELSLKVLERKMDFIESTGAKTIVTSNPGCQLQLEAGIANRGLEVKVKHIAEILDQSY